jgi:signal transduction histidine kinase
MIYERCPTPIVIITAHESHDLVEKASESGIAAYLTKPPKPDEIERAITIALARHSDILRHKHLIRELEENRELLNQLNSSKDRFFSILAHDLRSPVSSISVFIDQLIQNFDTLEKQELKEYLSVIQNSSKSLSDLLDNLLLWAAFQVNRIELKKSEVDLFEVVNSVEMLHAAALQHKSITFVNKISEGCFVFADPQMTNTILRNLISNALKFTPTGGKVEVSTEEDDLSRIVSVKDNGIGIPVENLGRIFQIGHQITSLGTLGEKGTGLGLTLCKEMVEKNNGEIWVESIPGKETVFSFSLPLSSKKS